MNTLIITEKPKVSERIAKALTSTPNRKRHGRVSYFNFSENGDEVYVASAAGHLYTLMQTGKGYQYPVFELTWEPLHTVERGKSYVKGYIDVLKELSEKADRFIIATDWDIEGELLGFNALRFTSGVDEAYRMRFSTLLPNDLKKAYDELDSVDKGLVNAGETRHIMDWYWGINVSRALMSSVRTLGSKFSISAGRVQTPALGILVRHKRKIDSFVPEKFYELSAGLKIDKTKVRAKHRNGRFKDRADAETALSASRADEALITRVDEKESKIPPPVPFDLGELQTEAFRVYRFSPKRTQDIAQSLYESSLISYPRTSSQKYPPGIGYRRLIETISKMKGFEAATKLLQKDKLYPRQGKKDDPAHPAIYPTGLIPKRLSADEEKVYRLIAHRFIATFGGAAELLTSTVDVALGSQPYYFSATRILNIGWIEFYPFKKVEEHILPPLKVESSVPVISVDLTEDTTKPPAKYTPATLIKELESRELGTKATRADVIDTLYRRGYITGVPIDVTAAGVAVIESLETYVPQLVDEELTRRFEKHIEEIRLLDTTKEAVLSEAKAELINVLDEFKKKEKEIGAVLNKAFVKTRREKTVLGACPNCKGELRIVRSKKTGKSFVGCSGYPGCKTSYPLPQKASVSPADKTCPSCALPMVRIGFGRKKILRCIDMNCKHTGQK